MHRSPLFTTRSRQRLMRGFSVLALLAMVLLSAPANQANAAALTNVRDYLNRQQAGITTGIQHEVFFTPATTLNGATSKLILVFPNDSANNTKWCRTAGALATPVGITAPTPALTTAESATTLPGTLTAACTQTPDTITITATGTPTWSSGTKYGVRITQSTGILGTGDAANNIKLIVKTNNNSADVDTYTEALSLVATDQYTVSATVDPTLSVALSATTVNLGTLDSTHVNYQGITSTVTTNAKNGYVSVVSSSALMTNGTDTIAAAGGTATVGTSGFGVSSSDASVSATIATSNASPACSTTQQSQSGNANATSLDANGKNFAASTSPASAAVTTLCFLAAVSATQAPGSYTATVTLVTTARF